MRVLNSILPVVAVLALVGGALGYHATKDRVFILQSYQPDYAWTRDVTVGLDRVTSDWSNIHVNTHFMYGKKFNNPDALKRAATQARLAIDRWKPDVLIAFDNIASAYVAKEYVGRSDIDLVFAAVNGSVDKFGYETGVNVAGIREDRPLGAARDAILSLRAVGRDRAPWDGSRPIRVRYLHDASRSVMGDRQAIDGFNWAPIDYVGSAMATDWAGWQDHVRKTAAIADVIIVTNYRQLSRDRAEDGFVPAKDVLSWTEENAGVPVVGLNGFATADGATFAIGASPFEQGQVAAELAERFLDGGPVGDRPDIRPNTQFVVSISASRLKKHRLALPDLYEAFSRATNTFVE